MRRAAGPRPRPPPSGRRHRSGPGWRGGPPPAPRPTPARAPRSASSASVSGPEHAQQVGDALDVLDPPVLGQPLELPLQFGQHLGVQQLAQLRLAQQLGQQPGVQRERGGPPLGERRVALVEELRDIAEEQGAGERGRLGGGDLDQADPAGLDVAHQLGEAGYVEDVLEAFADGLQHDRERAELAGHLEQLGGALALLPQRGALAGAAAGQQQGARGAFAEPGGEQGGAADLVGDELPDLALVEGDIGGPDGGLLAVVLRAAGAEPGRGRSRRRRSPGGRDPSGRRRAAAARCRRRRASPGRPCRTARRAGRRGPAPTGRGPGRRTASGPPPASRPARPGTAPPRSCGRPGHGRRPGAARPGTPRTLSRGPVVEPGRGQPEPGVLGASAPISRRNAPRARPSSSGRPSWSPFQKGSRPGTPGGGGDQHPVAGDVLDAPGRGAQGEDIADPGLVDHLLVELADPRRRPSSESAPARNTPKSPRSGMVPPEVTASRWAPGRPVTVRSTRSHTRRGRNSAKASEG